MDHEDRGGDRGGPRVLATEGLDEFGRREWPDPHGRDHCDAAGQHGGPGLSHNRGCRIRGRPRDLCGGGADGWRRVAHGGALAAPAVEPDLGPVDALPRVTSQRIPQDRGPRRRWDRDAARRDARPAVSERSRGVRLNHATRRVATLSRALSDATGSNAEGHDSDSRQGRDDANPQPRWVVRHERPEEVARTLQRPDGARQEENHAEHHNDRTHAGETRESGIRVRPTPEFTEGLADPPSSRLPVAQEVEPFPIRWKAPPFDRPRVRP